MKGERVEGRNGVVRKLPFLNIAFDASYLPLLQTRQSFYKGIAGEYAAFLRGPKHIDDFKMFGCNYWDKWGDANGDLRVDYGNAWINFDRTNQVDEVRKSLKEDPQGRRHLITGWDPRFLKALDLPCCHYSYQFYVRDGKYLDLLWNQRSADWCIGVPADAVLAAIMLHHFAKDTGYEPGVVKMSFGDCHIYENHMDTAIEQMERFAKLTELDLIEFCLTDHEFYSFNPGNVTLIDEYNPQKGLKYELNL